MAARLRAYFRRELGAELAWRVRDPGAQQQGRQLWTGSFAPRVQDVRAFYGRLYRPGRLECPGVMALLMLRARGQEPYAWLPREVVRMIHGWVCGGAVGELMGVLKG